MTSNPYLDITTSAMNTALGHHPRSFQCNIIPYVLGMNNSVEHPIHPVLLVQGMGSLPNYWCNQERSVSYYTEYTLYLI